MCKIVRVIAIITSSALLLTTLGGCKDAMEIDDEVYAMVLGIDKGVNNLMRVTIQYPTYKSDSGGGGEKKPGGSSENEVAGTNVHTVEASTILEALDMFGMAISRRVSLMHTKEILFSEEFARDGIGKYLGPIARFRETRRSMNVSVVRGNIEDFIKENKTNIGGSIAKALELMATQSDNTGFFPQVQFHDFYKSMLSPYQQAYTCYVGVNNFDNLVPRQKGNDPPLNIRTAFFPGELPRKGVAKREYAGMTLFDGDKMVGALDCHETRYFLMVTGDFDRGIITLEDKHAAGSAILLDMRLGRKPVLKGHFEEDKPVIDVKLQLEADIGAIQSRIPYEKVDRIDDLNNQAKEYVTMEIEKVIKKTQELNCDVFGFGHKLAQYFDTIPQWEAYNWLKHYKEAKVNLDVEVNIRRTGLMIHSAPIFGTEGAKDVLGGDVN